MKERRDCDIVQDLLPSYVEKLTRDGTNEFIEKHLKECSECNSDYLKLKKDLNFESDKASDVEIDYMKKFSKEKKKMRLSIKILIVIVIILLIYILSVIFKLVTLTNINNNYLRSKKANNFYYYSETDNTIINYWKKDNLRRMSIKSLNGNDEMVIWSNEETNEGVTLFESTKRYNNSNDNEIFLNVFPMSNILPLDYDNANFRFIVSLNPFMFITIGDYEGVKCYNISNSVFFTTGNEKIDRERGVLLYSESKMGIRKMKYSFDTVKDEDVEKPNVNEYTLVEKNNLQMKGN